MSFKLTGRAAIASWTSAHDGDIPTRAVSEDDILTAQAEADGLRVIPAPVVLPETDHRAGTAVTITDPEELKRIAKEHAEAAAFKASHGYGNGGKDE